MPRFSFRFLMAAVACSAPVMALAQIFNGPGLKGGVTQAQNINGPIQGTFRESVVKILTYVLNFVALASVIAIIVGGLWLILGMGSDDSKTKAKHIIMYTIIGLVIIILSRVIVAFFTNEIPNIFS